MHAAVIISISVYFLIARPMSVGHVTTISGWLLWSPKTTKTALFKTSTAIYLYLSLKPLSENSVQTGILPHFNNWSKMTFYPLSTFTLVFLTSYINISQWLWYHKNIISLLVLGYFNTGWFKKIIYSVGMKTKRWQYVCLTSTRASCLKLILTETWKWCRYAVPTHTLTKSTVCWNYNTSKSNLVTFD